MYQKITIISSSTISLPAVVELQKTRQLLEVLTTPDSELKRTLTTFNEQAPFRSIDGIKVEDYDPDTDLIIVIGYPRRLPIHPKHPMINVHFGELPENRGPDPVFWTLKQGKVLSYITLHKMVHDFDAGPIYATKAIDIMPNENYGVLVSRLSMLVVPMIMETIQNKIEPVAQDIHGKRYYPKPKAEDVAISWKHMKAKQIEDLVKACNPKYGGATTTIQGNEVSLLEVQNAQVNMPADRPLPSPGTIVHSSGDHGLYVICNDQQYLRINIIKMREGIFSGTSLGALGTPTGTLLGS